MFTSRSSSLPHNKLILAIADLACIAGTLFLAVLVRLGWNAGLAYAQDRASGFVVVSIAFPIAFYVGGLYDTGRLRSPASSFLPAAFSIGLGMLLSGAWLYLTWSPVGRGIVLVFSAALFAAVLVLRFAYVQAARNGVLSVRCLVIGTREQAMRVLVLVRAHPDAGRKIVGLVHCRESRPADLRAAQPDEGELAVLGNLDALEEIVAAHPVDRIVIATTLREEPVLLRRLRPLRYRGVGLVDLMSLYEELAREIPIDQVDDVWLFDAATMNSRVHIRRLKRVTDVIGALVLLVPAMLVLPLAALAVKLGSRGPVLFRQERVGLGSKPFMVLKLRTMFEDAEEATGPVWSTDEDPRITAVGRLLRKFRVDELPQLVNVLCGDMSLVGPRPERPVFVEKLEQVAPFYSERLFVRPGITGWAQVMAPYASTVGDSVRKLQFDLYYAKHLSLSLDVLILIKTAKTMLFGRERVQGGLTAGRQLEGMPEPMHIGRTASAAAVPAPASPQLQDSGEVA